MSKTLRVHLGQPAITTTSRWPPQQPRQQQVRMLEMRASSDSISRWLNDMFSTSFDLYIISYELPKGFMVPKCTMYNRTINSSDHIIHFKQLMTLDIGNDALMPKVFPASLHCQALSQFHRLLQNSMNTFRDVLEAFEGHYLCFTCQKHNISTLQNIKLQENETLRDFMK